jgi:NAD(P)-dependent dehydrogenase (short-subunit alcohol dehydrogenase family)
MRLKEKTAIVTGGGSGIGRATSILFAKEGARVLVVDLAGEKAEKVAHEITEAGGLADHLAEDISQEKSAERIVSHVVERWKRLDILVNNAANFHHKQAHEARKEDWEKVWSVNVLGLSFCCKYGLQIMQNQMSGSIVNVASINGLGAMPGWMTYNATKAAVVNMSRAMAMDYAPYNIRVNCICPGMIHTPAMDHLLETELHITPQEAEKTLLGPRCLMKRFGKAEEIAPAILFMASDEASYMTGATMVVDGGYTA